MPIDEELRWLDATGQAELVRSREVTALELVDAAIECIDILNPALNAVITPPVRVGPRRRRGCLPDGPFRGVPFLLKDAVAHSAGDPYHCGMRVLKDARLGGRRRHHAGRGATAPPGS